MKENNLNNEERFLTQEELARVLKVSKRTVQALAAEGMPCFYAGVAVTGRGGRPRYELDKVKTWLESRKGKGARA